MRDCKRCEMWKLILVMMTVAFVVLAWKVYTAEATHDLSSKRLDFTPVAERHLLKAINERKVSALALQYCPTEFITFDCTWAVAFYAHNPNGVEERVAFAIFSTDVKTKGLGCLLNYETADGTALVDRPFSETTCVKARGVNGLSI